jgi:aspartate/methionine/tyrosine aminotransferase
LPKAFKAVLAERRELICSRLNQIPHLFSYVPPQGAYYVFPKILSPHPDAWEFSMKLLHEAGVVVTPGSAFGPNGEGHVRMAFCVEDRIINDAFDRLDDFAARL